MFWNRAQLKSYAKQQLSGSYWLSFAVGAAAFLLYILACLVGGFIIGFIIGASRNYRAMIYLNGISAVIAAAICIFLYFPLFVGVYQYFIRSQYGERSFSNLFYAFRSGRYLQIVKTMFLMYLYIALWSLLFVVPGIIKMYEYRMVPHLLCECPHLSSSEILKTSSRMTDGEKGQIFVLDLSFIGWILLAVWVPAFLATMLTSSPYAAQNLSMVLGYSGLLFLYPYLYATHTHLYFALKQKYSQMNGWNYTRGTGAPPAGPHHTINQDQTYHNPPQPPQNPWNEQQQADQYYAPDRSPNHHHMDQDR